MFKLGLAKSVHHARVLIRQRHIRVGKQIVNVPLFLVRTDSQKHIDFALTRPLAAVARVASSARGRRRPRVGVTTRRRRMNKPTRVKSRGAIRRAADRLARADGARGW